METLDAWIKAQFAKGCGVESVIEAMMAAGHARDTAQQLAHSTFAALQATPILAQPQMPLAPPASQLAAPGLRRLVALAAPRIEVFEDFLSAAECATLIAAAQAKLERATVVDPATGDHVPHPERVSSGTHFPHGSSPTVAAIEQRIADCLSIPLRHQEAMQMLHYPVGGEYRPHFDYFPPEHPGSADALAQAGQRSATLVMYLNDVTEGGGTGFPEIGLTIAARRGNAVYFENLDAQGQPDPRTLHAGLPVVRGEKWIATKWFRQRPVFWPECFT